MTAFPNELVLVGSPFFPAARGVTVLSFLRSLRAIGTPVSVCDAFPRKRLVNKVDPAIEEELRDSLVSLPGAGINIHHLNANEIDLAQSHLEGRLLTAGYNILYPFWELNNYPPAWLEKIEYFDEIWAPSLYIEQTLRKSVRMPIVHMPLPVQVELSSFLGRRYFNLPESAYLFLFTFDFRSYVERKNPKALLRAFEKVISARPYADIRIVIKIHNTRLSEKTAQDYEGLVREIQASTLQHQVILIDSLYSDNQVMNLIRCCDCYVSLHRSEGFGLGMAEAMYLGKPVIATGYSGNLDFMSRDNSCLVDYELVPVNEGQYPFSAGQVWADPDWTQAAYFAEKLLDEPEFGRKLGQVASRHIRTNFSYLALGLCYQHRLEQLRKVISHQSKASHTDFKPAESAP